MKQISISFLVLIIISLELCAFFISSISASKTLKGSEFAKIDQCEKKFWWKNRKKFQKDLENLCMKQRYDRHDKYKKRYHKSKVCDKSEPWNLKDWTSKKNTWENLDKSKRKSSLKNLDKGRWKKSQKLLWKQFQKLADCKCSVLNYKLTNPVGISVCHQIASLNKTSGDFISSFTLFRSLKFDEFKGKSASIAIKYDKNIKLETRGLKKDDGFVSLKPLFTFKGKDSKGNTILISKAFIKGKVPSKKSMNKMSIDDISPVKYKVTVKVDKDTKEVFELKLGSDVKNLPISKFTPSKQYFPYMFDNDLKQPPPNPIKQDPPPPNPNKQNPNKPPPTNADKDQPPPTNTDPNQPPPTNTDPNQPPPTNTDPNQPNQNQPTPTNTDPNQQDPNQQDPNQPDPNQPDPNQPNPINQSPTNQDSTNQNPSLANSDNTSSSANPTAAATAADNQDVPGSTISTAPIGLMVFAVVVAVGAAFVGYTTYERRRYRNQFNRRQNLQQQNPSLAAVPDFGRAV